MSNLNFMQVVPNSGRFTNLDMMINFVSLRGMLPDKSAFVEELLVHLRNTQKEGYTLVKQKPKRKVATKKKKS